MELSELLFGSGHRGSGPETPATTPQEVPSIDPTPTEVPEYDPEPADAPQEL